MFLLIFPILFVCTTAVLVEPKFQVLTPDELMVEVPHYNDKELVTFRIGIRRAGQNRDDLEFGENDIDNNRVFIYDPRLKLKEGDVVNYLLAFRDNRGYQAQSGNYYFNGVYYKSPMGRRQRFRRHLSSTEKTTNKLQENTDETEEFDPAAPRFGGGGYGPRHHWPHRNHGGFNPFGGPPRQPFPGFPPQNGGPPFGGPNFGGGGGCNDHTHDRCHGRDTERWMSSTVPPNFDNYDLETHCRICNGAMTRAVPVTTRRTSTTTEEESPDIDIRFSD